MPKRKKVKIRFETPKKKKKPAQVSWETPTPDREARMQLLAKASGSHSTEEPVSPTPKAGPSTLTKVLAGASGATLGLITADLPGAFVGAKLGVAAAEGASLVDMAMDTVESTTGIPTSAIRSLFANPETGNLSRENSMSQLSRRSGRRSTPSYRSSLGRSFSRSGNRRRFGRKRGFRYRSKKKARLGKKKYSKTLKKKMRRFKKKMKKDKKSLCATQGVEHIEEIYGKIEDSHCAYLKHSTVHIEYMAQVICIALIRKLLSMAGFKLSDVTDMVSYAGVAPGATGDAYRILYSYYDPIAGVVPLASGEYLNLAIGLTLQDMPSSFPYMYNHIQDCLNGRVETMPGWLCFQVRDRRSNTATEDIYQTHVQLPLDSLKIHMFCKSVLKVQNRTKPPSDSSYTDTVDNQPLSGTLLTFKHGDPRLMNPGWCYKNTLFAGIPKRGIELFGPNDANFEGITNFEDPIKKNKFKNASHSAKVLINVGDSQAAQVSWHCSSNFQSFFKKFAAYRGDEHYNPPDGAWADRIAYVPGKSQLLGLQELIHTVNTNKITVGYERRYEIGCYFTKMKKSVAFTPTFTSEDAYNYGV